MRMSSLPRRGLLAGLLATPLAARGEAAQQLTVWHDLGDNGTKWFAAMAADIEDLSLSIADIEDDGKGVPVLIRQYLKAGGRVLGFSVDPSFSDTLDALILADLRSAPLPLLERCMGRREAQAFQCRGQNISLPKCFAETPHV